MAIGLPNALYGICAEVGDRTAFYERYGFSERERGRPGMFKVWTEDDR